VVSFVLGLSRILQPPVTAGFPPYDALIRQSLYQGSRMADPAQFNLLHLDRQLVAFVASCQCGYVTLLRRTSVSKMFPAIDDGSLAELLTLSEFQPARDHKSGCAVFA
jgi:hypothetical protein